MNKPSRSTNIPNENKETNINKSLWEILSWNITYNKAKNWYYQETSWRFIFWVDWWVNWINAKINLWNIPRIYNRMQFDLQIDEKWSKTPDEEEFFNLLISNDSKLKLENLLWYFTLINLKLLKENKEISWIDYLAFTYIKTLIRVIERIKKEWLDINEYIHSKDRFTKYLQQTISLIQGNRQKEMQDKINNLIWDDLYYKEIKKPLKIKKSNKKLKLAAWIALVWWLTFIGADWISKFNWPKSQIESKIQHTVAQKETAYSISKKYNITIDELKENNPEIEDISKLSIWQIINIK